MNYDSNKELQRLEIEQGKEVLESRPTSLVVTLTTKCNIRCRMCEEYRIPWEMPETTMREIVALFPYLDDVLWQGGEVLVLDYFLNTLLPEAGKYPRLHQSIITNGLPITPALAYRLVSDNMELTFSIDGANRHSYEAIRRGASFDRLTENVRLVGTLREKKKPKNMSLRMHSVIMKSSYRELVDFVVLAKDLGFDALHLMPIWGNLEGDENIFHHRDREALAFLEEHIPAAEEKARQIGLNLLNSLPVTVRRVENNEPVGHDRHDNHDAPAPVPAASGMMCHMPWKRLVINPAGYVCPACHCRAMVGNVNENTLAEIWNGAKMREYRARVRDGKPEGLCNPECVSGAIAKELRGL